MPLPTPALRGDCSTGIGATLARTWAADFSFAGAGCRDSTGWAAAGADFASVDAGDAAGLGSPSGGALASAAASWPAPCHSRGRRSRFLLDRLRWANPGCPSLRLFASERAAWASAASTAPPSGAAALARSLGSTHREC